MEERTRKIVVAGVLGAIAALLGWTRLGLIPWFAGASLTIIHVPVIIGAVLEGPVVGVAIGFIFGIFSLIQASMPNGNLDPAFLNPLVSVLPRLLFGPIAWLVWRALQKWPTVGLLAAGVVGSLAHTALVLGIIGLLGIYPWPLLGAVAVANGPIEAVAAGLITLAVVAAWRQIEVGRRKGADL